MKKYTQLLLMMLVLACSNASAQKFRLSSPPVNGWFYMDTTDCQNKVLPNVFAKCIDVICDSGTVYAPANGQVLYCEPYSNRTYQIAIRYGTSIVVYTNIAKKKVMRRQMIRANAQIGDVPLNPRDKRYHLGMQVAQSNAPNKFLWFEPLLSYLNVSRITE